MRHNGIQAFMRASMTRLGAEIHILQKRDGKQYLAKPLKLVYKEVNQGEGDSEPTLMLSDDEISSLYVAFGSYLKSMNKLPIDGRQEDREKHLEDMRRIVFHQLKIDR